MRSLMPVMTSGSQSLAKPGSMPFTHSDTPAPVAALRRGSVISAGTTPSGYCRNTGPLDTTLAPARRILSRSARASGRRWSAMAVCTTQSGASANRASTSSVAATPRLRPRPARSPASRPTLSGFDTHTPTSSRSGRASMPARAWRPTLPVPHNTTRYVMARSSARSAQVDLGALGASVDLEDLAGDEVAGGGGEIDDARRDVLGLPDSPHQGGLLDEGEHGRVLD